MKRTLRIVHTSDWHLGHMLSGQSREYEHRAFFAWLLDRLEDLEADALLIAGDIFHTSNPSASARQMFNDLMVELRRRLPHLTPVAIGGNHDSAAQIDAQASLFAALGVDVVGGLHWTNEGYDVERALAPIRRGADVLAWVAAVPFLRRCDLDPVSLRERGHATAVREAYRAVLDRAASLRSEEQALIAMGHGTMTGGRLSTDSERPIVCGGEEALPVEMFPADVGYVALGHLHFAQSVGGREHVRYSGSPIPLSMSEDGYEHQVVVADFAGAQLVDIKCPRVPRTVPLVRFRHDEPLPIDETLASLATLSLRDRPLEQQPLLEVSVFLDRVEHSLASKVREAIAGKPVRLVAIRSVRPESAGVALGDAVQACDLSDLDPTDVFRRMHEHEHGTEPDDELLSAYAELLQLVHQEAAGCAS